MIRALLTSMVIAISAPLAAHGQDDAPLPAWTEQMVTLGTDELRLRLAPLELEALERIREEAMSKLRARASSLSDELVERMRLERAPEPDAEAIARVNERIDELTAGKKELVSRLTVLLEAIKAKGGDVGASEAYIGAIASLDPQETSTAPAAPADPQAAPTEADQVRVRASELIAIVRAEPPAHERSVPWEVPLAEFELELQPLPVETIVERLEKWRELLQREVRKRVRIDILLSDAKKLEQVRESRREAAALAGVADQQVSLDAIKSRLAEQSQEQQRIISAIVKRMEIAIRLVEVRGGEADAFASYITAATGQRLNLTDPAVLRAQVSAWLKSPDGGVRIGLNIAKFTGIVVVFWMLGRLLGGVTSTAVRRMPRASTLLRPILAGAVRRLTLFIGLVIGVSMLGVNIGPLLAMIGAAGLVIGLALQGTLSNFASGILILLTRPFDVGDVINAGGVFGKVEAMSLVTTRILTFDNQINLVPNNQVWNGVITNVTGKSTRRVDLTFGIGYRDDTERAIEIIRDAIGAHPLVLADPAPNIRVNQLGDNSVSIIARPWTKTADYWDVFWDLTHEVKRRFDAEGVNIPYPQRDVHIPGPIEIKLTNGDLDAISAARGGARARAAVGSDED